MDELQQKIVQLVADAGGSIVYADLLDQMDAVERQHLYRALTMAENRGQLHQEVRFDSAAGTNTHSVKSGKRQTPPVLGVTA